MYTSGSIQYPPAKINFFCVLHVDITIIIP